MNTLKILVVLFTAFVAFGMIAPPLAMNRCLIPVAASAGYSNAPARIHLAISPECRKSAQQILLDATGF